MNLADAQRVVWQLSTFAAWFGIVVFGLAFLVDMLDAGPYVPFEVRRSRMARSVIVVIVCCAWLIGRYV